MATPIKKEWKGYALVFLSFLLVCLYLNQSGVGTSWSLLPPAIAIFIAFITGRLSISLLSAVLVGSFISAYGRTQSLTEGFLGAGLQSSQYFYSAFADSTNLQILGFVFFILSMVHVMTASGGLHAMVYKLQKWIVGPKSAQLVTAILGCLIFIDDYANTMIVGSTMKKVTDRYRVSREKLAFIVDATSAPVAGIALVSTWIGYEVGLFSEMAQKFNWGIDGYAIFLDAIEFRFYCFFMLIFVFANILFGFDFGPMKSFEKSPVSLEEDEKVVSGNIGNALLPLILLLVLVFAALWWDGGGWNKELSVFRLNDWRHVLTQSKNGISILFVSSGISYLVAIMLGLMASDMTFKSYTQTFVAGIKSAWVPIVILVLAWSLKEVCDDLKAGEYIVSILGDRVDMIYLPLLVFIVSALTAFSTGTSWGTMAILIPTVTPLAVELSGGHYGVYVSLSLAAILDGAIMGDHCSPISDTTIMSSISTDCNLLSHVKTQLPYSLIVGTLALGVGYLPSSLGFSMSFSFGLALLLIVGLFFVLKRVRKQQGVVS